MLRTIVRALREIALVRAMWRTKVLTQPLRRVASGM